MTQPRGAPLDSRYAGDACEGCGERTGAATPFCVLCGHPRSRRPSRPAAARCSGCDARLPAGVAYCPGCGTAARSAARSAAPPSPREPLRDEALPREPPTRSSARGIEWQEGVVVAPDAPLESAGFASRLLALVVDGVVVSAVLLVPLLLLLGRSGGGLLSGLLVFVLLYQVLAVVALALMVTLGDGSSKGQTLGKQLAGIRVVDDWTGLPAVGLGTAFGRYAAYCLGSSLFLLGPLSMLWDARRRAWHDRATGTRVVVARRSLPGSTGLAAPVLCALLLAGALLVVPALASSRTSTPVAGTSELSVPPDLGGPSGTASEGSASEGSASGSGSRAQSPESSSAGAGSESDAAEEFPQTAPDDAADASERSAGSADGRWVVMVASVLPSQADSTEQFVRDATARGLPDVQVMSSDGYPSLRDGYLLVFSPGPYSSGAAAAAACRDAGYSGSNGCVGRVLSQDPDDRRLTCYFLPDGRLVETC